MKKIRSLPFGYSIANGRIVIDNAEAEVIREIFDEYTAGASMKTLAERLTASQTPYLEKRTEWNKNLIARILQNERYTGKGEFSQIVTEETFLLANSQKKNRTTYTRKPDRCLIDILQQRIRCEQCGDPMIYGAAQRYGTQSAWRCTNPSCKNKVQLTAEETTLLIQRRLNMVIDNTDILTDGDPYREHDEYDSMSVIDSLERLCDTGNYDDQYLIQVIMGNASDLYNHFSNSRLPTVVNVNAAFANAVPTDTFNAELFLLTVKHVTLHQDGNLTLTLKSDIEI